MADTDKLDQLVSFELFRRVPKKVLPRVAAMLGEPESVPAGHLLTEQGRLATDAFLVIDGTADVFVGDRAVAEIGPGETIGEMAIVDHLPRSAYVVARTAMELYRVPAETFLEMLDDIPTVARGLLQLLSGRLRRLDIRPTDY